MDESLCTALTNRERDCLRLVTPGFEEKRIAEQLGISHHTVKVHLRSARSKLRVATSVEAAAMLSAKDQAMGRGTSTASSMVVPGGDAASDETGLTDGGAGQTRIVREEPNNGTGLYYPAETTPIIQRRVNNALTVTARLIAILLILAFITLAIVASPALYRSFQEVANRVSPP